MKKMYKQPIVEQTQLKPANIVLAGSPAAGISGGGSTGGGGIPGSDPIPGE